jgi:hypothetical protein
MKAKYYIGILSALMLAGFPLKAQYADNRDFRNDGSSTIVNNYYDDYDYYFSSRINRFHRSYAVFDYYSPLYTETYWYNYRPYSRGISIYGGTGIGFGLSFNYPVYYSGWRYGSWYNYDYGWYDPYYGSYWWGYDPFYYSWYSPMIININIGSRWGHNYWGRNRHNYWYNDYRPVYNTYNNYYNNRSTRYSSNEYPDRGRSADYNRTNTGGVTRREATSVSGSRTEVSRVSNRETSNTGNTRSTITRPSVPSNRNIEQPVRARSSSPSRTGTTMSQGRSSSPSRTGTTMSQGRSSSSSRTGTSASQGRSSSSRSTSKSSSSKSSSGSSSSSKKSRR